LKKENISTNQNLYDAGGDSLSIINIISQVYSKFNFEIPLNDINKMDTVIKMALYIKKNKDKSIIKHRNDRIVLLKKVRDSKNNLFLIHAGNGEVNNYKKLSDYLNAACWGIRFGTSGAAPQNITINQIAREYVNMIKELQPNEPYLLGGWCIGGTIAFEMANILEQMGDRVNLVCLFNSISVKNWSDIKPFSFDTEMHLIRSFFDNEIDRQVENHKDINELWKFVSDKKIEKTSVINQLPDEVRDAIPGLERIQTIDMFMYINRIRTLHQARALYKPQRALNAQIVFLNAVYDKIISDKELNINTWNSYCNTEIIRIDLPSNHYTLFEEPVVYELASKINEIIAKKD
jgi:thioesterase domain-containing protein/acyl carrier protein